MKTEGSEEKSFVSRKAGFYSIVIVGLLLVAGSVYFTVDENDIVDEVLDEILDDTPVYEETWHLVQQVSWNTVGENDPGDEGWLSTFQLDYGQVPETVLANNATDWSADANTRGYVDTDNTEADLKSEDPAYFCVRCKYDNDAMEGATWNWSRFRVNLTVSGDETISGVGEYDNSSSAGDAVISASDTTHIYINFWWDDGVDGYRITDDGSLVWSISIYEKY